MFPHISEQQSQIFCGSKNNTPNQRLMIFKKLPNGRGPVTATLLYSSHYYFLKISLLLRKENLLGHSHLHLES